ncbi:von Willebrand factor type A domain-containing protein [Winogradskyella sp. DF17]|uniref:von Willebrand factor type A domain-containing protein n=1 Tax=Winogradskyella pelagia TaxID=2819984 RepID=A0ABS3T4B6_9FLAO|nr:VWA domain-containing protein [Winogradskyella sp. DF17]MBO3117587.1 von Willebrand factor type A domain-containing protein [Winogradskyella sp. DF17]
MKTINLLLIFTVLSLSIHSQQKEITGKVTMASDGLPLPGANVTIKGTSNGTQTDFDGNYKFNVHLGDILEISYVGLKTAQITIGNPNRYDVALEPDARLEEVVVTGYTTGPNYRSRQMNIKMSERLVINPRKIKESGSISEAQDISKPLYVLNGEPISEEKFNNLKTKKVRSLEILDAEQGRKTFGYEGKIGVVCATTRGKRGDVDFGLVSDFLNEAYSKIQENEFKHTQNSPLSTFSIDVDKASYSNIRRLINNGQAINPNAVKIEEMINYFNYKYPQPIDKHPFSINTEVVNTPWHKDTQLVRIGLQGKSYDNTKLPPSNLTFLIDVSGSMGSPNKLPLLKSAFKLLVNQLREQDNVSIVVYAGAAGLVLEPTSGNNKEKILSTLNNLRAGGSTAGGAGIELAYKLAQENFKKNGNNRVILATDGDFNVGASSDTAMEELIEEKRKSGVFLSVLGFGMGNYKDSKLEVLADKGNGNHAYIDTMQEAQKVFGKEFGGTLYTIAKDVKIQVEFNPNKVQAYRLIGYENRLLNDEDFIDDTIDAGELGSGHTVTALYEVVPVGIITDYVKAVSNLKYTDNRSSDKYLDELFTVKFRYKKPDATKSIEMVHVQNTNISEPSADMNFASAVALFGMHLRKSKYFNNTSIELVVDLAKKGRGKDENGYRSEFIRLIKSHQNLQ